jgi:hypothetical protein
VSTPRPGPLFLWWCVRCSRRRRKRPRSTSTSCDSVRPGSAWVRAWLDVSAPHLRVTVATLVFAPALILAWPLVEQTEEESMRTVVLLMLAGLTAGACTTTEQRVGGAAVGAGVGAVAGPVGAIAGGAVGAATGPTVARGVRRTRR